MKVVFFVNIIRQARCIRRIEDFINHGYDVEVYGFDREGDNRKSPTFEHNILGKVSRTSSYFERLMMMKQCIKDVVAKCDKDTIFYIFSLDVAIAFMLNGGLKRKYIYEVSDLMELEVNNSILSKILISVNRHIINRSEHTIMTSPGFATFYFGKNIPDKITIVANKLNKRCLEIGQPKERCFNVDKINIGFTGAIRSKAVYNFIEVVGSQFPNISVNLHGIFTDDKIYGAKIREAVSRYDNVNYFGPFKNPDDFPEIYSNIDLVLCLYTAKGNDRILEPNKLYESIFYEKPIIVSKNTFTGDFVEEKMIGYTVDGENQDDIISLLKSITSEGYHLRTKNCAMIPKESSVDDTTELFKNIETLLK